MIVNKQFFKKEIQVDNKYFEKSVQNIQQLGKCKLGLLKFNLTPVRMVVIKKTKDNKCWRGYEGDPYSPLEGVGAGMGTVEIYVEITQKTKKRKNCHMAYLYHSWTHT